MNDMPKLMTDKAGARLADKHCAVSLIKCHPIRKAQRGRSGHACNKGNAGQTNSCGRWKIKRFVKHAHVPGQWSDHRSPSNARGLEVFMCAMARTHVACATGKAGCAPPTRGSVMVQSTDIPRVVPGCSDGYLGSSDAAGFAEPRPRSRGALVCRTCACAAYYEAPARPRIVDLAYDRVVRYGSNSLWRWLAGPAPHHATLEGDARCSKGTAMAKRTNWRARRGYISLPTAPSGRSRASFL